MKGIAISLVVIGHIFNRIGDNSINEWIYKFHMPFFFMLSGFLAIKALQKPLILQIKNKFISLIIPFFFSGFSISFFLNNTDKFFLDTFHGGYWFLLSLFTCWIIFLPLSKILFHYRANILLEILILIIPFFAGNILMSYMDKESIDITSFSFTFAFYRFFILGYFIGKIYFKYNFKVILEKSKLYKDYVSALSILTFLGISLSCIAGKNFISLFPLTVWQFLLCISLFLSVYYFHNIINFKILKVLSYLGENSLSIYLFHYLFVYQFPLPEIKNIPLGFQTLIVIVLYFIVIISTMIISTPFKKNSILAFLFLGNKIKLSYNNEKNSNHNSHLERNEVD